MTDSPRDPWDDGFESIEKLPSGKFRGVVKVNGQRATTKAVATRNEAVALEAQLTLKMGSEPTSMIHRLPELFLARGIGKVTPAVLDDLSTLLNLLRSC